MSLAVEAGFERASRVPPPNNRPPRPPFAYYLSHTICQAHNTICQAHNRCSWRKSLTINRLSRHRQVKHQAGRQPQWRRRPDRPAGGMIKQSQRTSRSGSVLTGPSRWTRENHRAGNHQKRDHVQRWTFDVRYSAHGPMMPYHPLSTCHSRQRRHVLCSRGRGGRAGESARS